MSNPPEIKGFVSNIAKKRELGDKENILFVEENNGVSYTDFLEKPLLLVSDTFKIMANLYNRDYVYRIVVLTEKSGKQSVYWHIDMPEADCLSPRSEYNHDGTLKKIVMQESAAQGRSLLRIKNVHWSAYVIRLDLAESILRRELGGFVLEKLEHD